jgi:hypothetical protein
LKIITTIKKKKPLNEDINTLHFAQKTTLGLQSFSQGEGSEYSESDEQKDSSEGMKKLWGTMTAVEGYSVSSSLLVDRWVRLGRNSKMAPQERHNVSDDRSDSQFRENKERKMITTPQ